MLSVLMVGLLTLFTLFAAGCGASGGYDSGEDGDGEPAPPAEPTYNFTGTVYGKNGLPVSDAVVQVFSQMLTSVTNANGEFAMNVASELHTILSSKDGFIDSYVLADLSPGSALGQSVLLQYASAPVVDVAAKVGAEVESNPIDGNQARLSIPSQSSYTVGEKTGLGSAEMSLELIDVTDPLPVPMPSPTTLDPNDVIISGKEAPYSLVTIKPALLQLEAPATLVLPSHADVVGGRVLRYDPYVHKWVDTGVRADDTPENGIALNITTGGPYGLFYKERRVGTVQGTASPNTLVLIGDKIIEVPANGRFQVNEVPVPPGGVLTVMSIDPATGRVVANEINLVPGEVATVDLSMVEVGSVNIIKIGGMTVTAEAEQSITLIADGSSRTPVKAEVIDVNGRPASDGSVVIFSSTHGAFANPTATTVNGQAVAYLLSPDTEGQGSITASAGGILSAGVPVTFVPEPNDISISTSKNSVKSDNSDSAIITVTVLNENNAPYSGLTVTFNSTGGQLSTYTDEDGNVWPDPDADPSTVVTGPEALDASFGGKAMIRFSSGTNNQANRTVTITASVAGLDPVQIPVQVDGTTITAETETTILEIGGRETSELTITVKDAGDKAIYDAPVEFSVEPEGTLSWQTADETDNVYRTDVTGKLDVIITGEQTSEEAVLTVESLGAKATQKYKIGSLLETFAIIVPEEDPVSLKTNEELSVTVRANNQRAVKFSTTFGSWQNDASLIEVPVAGDGTATARLKAGEPGLATVQAFDADDPETSDILKVAISAPYSQSSKISLQANESVVAPSTGDVSNSVTIQATVRTASDQVVGGAPVIFTIEDTTGGGEYLSPVIVYTNDNGIATTTFTSGVLGSDNVGVKVVGKIIGMEKITDEIRIVIGGTAGSIHIGRSTVVQVSEDNTHYILPMSVLVSDTHGNPVAGTRVTLGTWPVQYATGYWTVQPCEPVQTGTYANEDENRNLSLENGEDANKDDKLTPPSSAAGSAVPSIVTTDENGVAAFDLYYLKNSSVWIKDEVSASAIVMGTETRSTYDFWLPFLEGDACNLPHSPYNREAKPDRFTISANPDELPPDGISQSTITAEVFDKDGFSVGGGVQVTFTVEGPGGFPNTKTYQAYTDQTGVATAFYTAGRDSGTATITATSEDATASVQITLSQGKLFLTADVLEILANGEEASALTASILNVEGNPITENVLITFSTSAPGFFAESGATSYEVYSAGGGAAATFKSNPIAAGSGATNITVSASAEGGLSDQITIAAFAQEIGSISLTAAPTEIPADGTSVTTITANIVDSTGVAVGKGVPVTFETTSGTFPNGEATYTTTTPPGSTGTVVVTLKSEDQVGTANITATSRNVSGATAVQFTESGSMVAPAVIEMLDDDGDGTPDYPDPDWIAVKGSREQTATFIRFRALKSDGTVVDNGVPIKFSIYPPEKESEMGVSLSKNTDSTRNEDGVVSTVLYSGYKAGSVAVKAYYEDENGTERAYVISSDITIRGGLPVGEAFGIEAESLVLSPTENNQSTKINVTASDIYGNPVPKNTTITYKTYNTGGILEPLTNTISHEEGANAGYSYSWLYWTTNPAPLHGVVSVTAETTGGDSTHVTSIAAFPEDFNAKDNYILFAGTDGGGVYRSTDSGRRWTNTSRSTNIQGQNYIDPYINDMAVDWDNTNLVYAATGHGGEGSLYRSRDRGLTWDSNNPQEEWRGILPVNTASTSVICDYDDTNDPPIDNYSYVWVGTQGGGVYYAPDGNADYDSNTPIFTQSSTFGNGRYVQDIVRARGTHGPSAVLYAATANGIWRSLNGGSTWKATHRFSGDFINCLAIHPKSSGGADDVIYAGTETAGVWVSQDSGSSWVPYTDGMRQGDSWDESRMIKALMVDDVNNILYAITYFWEVGESRPEGNLFAYRLRPDGTMGDGAWFEANSDLPQYQNGPSGEGKRYAQHALALISDVQGNPSTLFIGGEGINLYRAENGLETGSLDWENSGDGLTNRIMARTQVIFTGIGDPGSSPYFDYTFSVEPDTPAASLDGGPNVSVGFNVCAEDAFGNPPTPGSTISYSVDGGGETSLVTFGADDYDFGTCSRKARFSVPMTFEETENPDTGETEYGDLQTTVDVYFEDVLTGIRRIYRYN